MDYSLLKSKQREVRGGLSANLGLRGRFPYFSAKNPYLMNFY